MNKLKAEFENLPLVKRIKELEHFIDNNANLNALLVKLKEIQKKIVNAKEFNQPKQLAIYKKEYDNVYATILDFPFVEEYLDLLEEANQKLLDISNIIEKTINDKLLN